MRNWVKNWIVHVIRMCVHGMWNRCYPLFLLCRIAFFYLVVRYFVRWMSVERLRNQFENSIAENGTVWCVYFYHSTNSDEKKMSFFVKTKVFFGDKRNTKKRKLYSVQCTHLIELLPFFPFVRCLLLFFFSSFHSFVFLLLSLRWLHFSLLCFVRCTFSSQLDSIVFFILYFINSIVKWKT